MKIAICDDDYVIREVVKSKCANYFSKKNLDVTFRGFESGEELLESNEKIDIIFLDIEMKGLDGIAVAKLLRKKFSELEIIFLSSHCEYMQQAFEVRAYRYLFKKMILKKSIKY